MLNLNKKKVTKRQYFENRCAPNLTQKITECLMLFVDLKTFSDLKLFIFT